MKSKNFFCIILLMFISVSIYGEARNALLIANGKYAKLSKLDNPIPEAIALKKSLLELGFEVTLISNATLENTKIEMKKFRDKIKNEKGIAFFHYGGHAVQVSGENYLIPIDADIPNEDYVSTRTYPIKELMISMVGETNIVVLDCCRNNPIPASSRNAVRGLQMISDKLKNSVIVYSAQPGQTAEDGVFTPIFTRKILDNKSFSEVLIDVRNEVSKITNGKQIPGEYNEITEQIYLANVPGKDEKLAKEIAYEKARKKALEADLAMAQSSKEKERINQELERVEAETKHKQLELEKEKKRQQYEQEETRRRQEEFEKQKRQQEELDRIKRENEIKRHELEKIKTATTNDKNSIKENNVSSTNIVKSKSVVKPATVKDNLKSHNSLNISFLISCMIGIIISSGLIYVFYILWVMYNH
ncbi:MAG: caspase family protein [Spirochaetales bacterium]|nr:caspase family protein [Spirochaetales bacterium]